jgi:hypothetical protein
LTADELKDHVSKTYITGCGGPLNEKGRERGIGDHAATQAKYLKELNQRPALVLNADYQVCASHISFRKYGTQSWKQKLVLYKGAPRMTASSLYSSFFFFSDRFLIFSIPYAFSIAPQLPSPQSLELAGCRKSHF